MGGVHAFWDLWRDRQVSRRRDWLVSSALLKEVFALQGTVTELGVQTGNEAAAFATWQWSVKPFRRLQTGLYNLIKSDPPRPLLESTCAVSLILTIGAWVPDGSLSVWFRA